MRNRNPYGRFVLMVLISFISMYVLMYAMVNSFSNVFANYNQFYMAGLMASPMAFIELWLMRAMYPNRRWNTLIFLVSIILIVFFWTGVRQQVFIGDEQFLKSMIPHHASALLMCEKAKLEDPEIKSLCQNILRGQQTEIDFMKAKLNQLK